MRRLAAVALAAAGLVLTLAGQAQASPHMLDGDAAISVGHVWLYADTVTPNGRSLEGHSAAVVEGHRVLGQLLPNRGRDYYWPSAAVGIGHGSILVTLMRVRNPHAPIAHPASLAAIVSTRGRFEQYVPWRAAYVAGLARVGHTIIAYGTSKPSPSTYGRTLTRATVHVRGSVLSRWHEDPTPLYSDADTVVSVWHGPSAWHLVTLHDGPYGDGSVVMLTSPSPAFEHATVSTVATGYGYRSHTGRVFYNVEHHAGGLTICRNWIKGSHHKANTYAPDWIAATP